MIMKLRILLLTAILSINLGFAQIHVGSKKVTPSVDVRLKSGSAGDSIRIWINTKAEYNLQKPIDAEIIVITDSIPSPYSLADGDYGDVVVTGTGTVWNVEEYIARTDIDEVFDGNVRVNGLSLNVGTSDNATRVSDNGNGISYLSQNMSGDKYIIFRPNGIGSTSFQLELNNLGEFKYDNNDIWHAGNDGTGSTLDADLLDGFQSSSFVRSDIDDIVYGSLIYYNPFILDWTNPYIEFKDNNGAIDSKYSRMFWYENGFLLRSLNDNLTTKTDLLEVGEDRFQYKNADIWNQANDGAGSGLDADLLDGISSSNFLRSDQSDTFNGTLSMNGNIYPSTGFGLGSYTNPNQFAYMKYLYVVPNSGSYDTNWRINSDAGNNIDFNMDVAGNKSYSTKYSLNQSGEPVNDIDLVNKGYLDEQLDGLGGSSSWTSLAVLDGLYSGATSVNYAGGGGFHHIDGVGYINYTFVLSDPLTASGTLRIELNENAYPLRQIVPVYIDDTNGTYHSLVGKIEPNGTSISIYKVINGVMTGFADNLPDNTNIVISGMLYMSL